MRGPATRNAPARTAIAGKPMPPRKPSHRDETDNQTDNQTDNKTGGLN